MLRVERNAAFWTEVAEHPLVAAMVGTVTQDQLAPLIAHPDVLPLAAVHGGFIFVGRDPFARVLELHTLFLPEGWGREVHAAAKEAFSFVFERGVDVVFTHQVEGNSKSQPPRSFGFRPVGDFGPTPVGTVVKTWILTSDAWRESPGRKSQCRSLH